MEKEAHQPESLATVTIKPDYPPSEAYSSEPPPAYHRTMSSAVQVARIVSFTVVAVSILLGCFWLASAYISANASCKQLEQELELLSETAERLQPLQPEALVREEQTPVSNVHPKPVETVEVEEKPKPEKKVEEVVDNSISKDVSDSSQDGSDSSSSDDSEDDDERTIQFKIPLELDFDDLAGAMMGKHQRSRMNCVVEKKRAEQMVDHQPKTIHLPFGLNLTTDPRFEHVSGERMAIFCESGHDQRRNEPEETEETIMIQPMMIPIPQTHFQTHMPMQEQPPQFMNRIPFQPQVVNRLPFQPVMQNRLPQMMPNRIPMQQAPPMPHPMETLRPPMPVTPVMSQSQPGFPPTQVLHHIAQQIIAQKLAMEAERNQEEDQTNDVVQHEPEEPRQQQHDIQQLHVQQMPQNVAPQDYMMAHRIPIPEEILSQINRLPNRDVILAVQEQDPEEQSGDVNVVQQQRESAQEMNGRQVYGRAMPMNMPVQAQQEQQAAASDELRPHYLHPRSVRSVDNIFNKSAKRVKRCSCDCAC